MTPEDADGLVRKLATVEQRDVIIAAVVLLTQIAESLQSISVALNRKHAGIDEKG